MAHTRPVTGTIHKPDGTPWADFAVGFDVAQTTTTTHATLPGTAVGAQATAHTVTATTDANGVFRVDLETGVAIQVTLTGALVTSGTSTRYPPGAVLSIVVPEGDTPITLEEIIAADATPVTPTLLGRVLPDGGTTGQALVKASDTDFDVAWSDVAGGPGGAAAWGGITGTLADQTDLATALSAKSDSGHTHTMADVTDLPTLGTAAEADAGDFATAAQGAKADSAVQPDTLATALSGKADDGDVTAVSGVLTAHTGDTANPHGVTAAQTGAYTTAQTDTLLASKANSADLGTAATTDRSAYATAAQGATADTAVQPGDLAPVATTGAYGDLTGSPAIPHALADLDTTVTGAQLDSLKGKVDGIEAGATADMTGAEIKAAYEGESDTNAYTDAERAKLAGIATGATANATDAQLRDRATHTGSQAISTVSGLQDAIDTANRFTVTYVIDGGGAAIMAGFAEDLTIGFGGTPVAWDIRADQVGSFVATISKATYANYPTFTSISGSEQPTLSSARKNQDTSLTTWGTFAAGDTLRLEVNSASTVQHVVVSIHATRA